MSTTCEICVSKSRSIVRCPDCGYSMCTGCTKRYLFETPQGRNPRPEVPCPSCNFALTRKVFGGQVSQTFLKDTWKKWREKVLLGFEQSRIQETMPYVTQELRIRRLNAKLSILRAELTRVAAYSAIAVGVAKTQATDRMWLVQEEITRLTLQLEALYYDPPSVQNFLYKCPVVECNGYIARADVNVNTCEICKARVCNDCLQVAGENHRCDPKTASSLSMIGQQCRNCPNCKIPIFKHEDGGCDQMFCTECHVFFSWSTGRIDTSGRYHNPHYFDHIRANNDGQLPRQRGDLPRGGLPASSTFMKLVKSIVGMKAIQTFLIRVYLVTQHISDIMHRYDDVEPDNTFLRVKFILKEVNQIEFARTIQQREKLHAKNTAIYTTMQNFVVDSVRILHDMTEKGLLYHHVVSLERLKERYNLETAETSKYFQSAINPAIDLQWKRVGC